MTRICPRRIEGIGPARRGACGFTLIEMLVVLAVIGLLAALVAGRWSAVKDIAASRHAGAVLRAAAIVAHARAMTEGMIVSMPEAAKGIATGDLAYRGDDGSRAIRFYPDGSSTGGTVLFQGHAVLAIDWLSGAAHDPG